MFRTLLAAALVAMAAPAWSQTPAFTSAQQSPAAQPGGSAPSAATPAEIAAARAVADQVIARADAGDLFTNVTDGKVAAVRHTKSGMVCTFEALGENDGIVVFPAGDVPRGDDVACRKEVEGVSLTHYATRYPEPETAKQGLEMAVDAIRQRFPDAKWYEGATTELSTDRTGKPEIPQTWQAHYVVGVQGHEYYTSARVAVHGEWQYKQRLTVALDEVALGQLVGGVEWMMLLQQLVDGEAI